MDKGTGVLHYYSTAIATAFSKEKLKKKKSNYFSLNWVCLQDSKCFWVHLESGLEWSALEVTCCFYIICILLWEECVSGFKVIYHPTQGCLSRMPFYCTVQVWGLVFINVVSMVSELMRERGSKWSELICLKGWKKGVQIMIGTGPFFSWIMMNEVCIDIFEEAQWN